MSLHGADFLKQFQEVYDGLPQWGKLAVGVLTAAPVAYFVFNKYKTRASPIKKEWKKDVVYLFQFFRGEHTPSPSPYCLKLESWLRLYDFNYENVDVPFGTMSKVGLSPFIEVNGKEHPDSAFAIRDLIEMYKKGEEKDLSNEQRAAARAIECLVEESLIQSLSYVRYYERQAEYLHVVIPNRIKNTFLTIFFSLMRPMARRTAYAKLWDRGLARYPREEIINKGLDDLRALELYLGKKQFFMGDKPTRVDCAVFGCVANIAFVPFAGEHLDCLQKECPSLKAWSDRMKTNLWPDWDQTTRTGDLNTKWRKEAGK